MNALPENQRVRNGESSLARRSVVHTVQRGIAASPLTSDRWIVVKRLPVRTSCRIAVAASCRESLTHCGQIRSERVLSSELTGICSAPLAPCQWSAGLETKTNLQSLFTAPLASCQWTVGLQTAVCEGAILVVVFKPAFHRRTALSLPTIVFTNRAFSFHRSQWRGFHQGRASPEQEGSC